MRAGLRAIDLCFDERERVVFGTVKDDELHRIDGIKECSTCHERFVFSSVRWSHYPVERLWKHHCRVERCLGIVPGAHRPH